MGVSSETGPQDPVLEAVIFDLDGVLVTTDRYHYLAWKELADDLGIPFDQEKNHQLRGVSRRGSLQRIYGDLPLPDEDTFEAQCTRKNDRYRELIGQMTEEDVLPGALDLLNELHAAGIPVGIASASRNAPLVLERTRLTDHVDALADGNAVSKNKPDPEVFLYAAKELGCPPRNCIGVEDAEVGVESIRRAGMVSLGIGASAAAADHVVAATSEVDLALLREVFDAHSPVSVPPAGGTR